MNEEQLVTKLRRHNEELAEFEKKLRHDYADVPADVAADVIARTMTARRAKAAEEAHRLALPVLNEIRTRRNTQRDYLPGVTEGAAGRVADAMTARSKDRPDPVRLARTSATDLARLAADTSDVVTVREILRELSFRAESDESVTAGVRRLEQRLDEVVRAEPETVRRRAEYDRLGIAAENIADTLKAIETGAVDIGVRFDTYRDVRRRLDAGEIDRDQAQQILQTTLDAAR